MVSVDEIYAYEKSITKIAPRLSFEEALYLLYERNLQDILHPYSNDDLDFAKTIQSVLVKYYKMEDEEIQPWFAVFMRNKVATSLISKWLLRNNGIGVAVTTYWITISDRIYHFHNWGWLKKTEILLEEYPSVLTLLIAILWSLTAILIAIFDD